MLYKKVDTASTDCVTNALDIFHTPGTNVGVTKTQTKEFLTLNPVTDPPYHFKIPPGSSFIDLNETVLIMEAVMQTTAAGVARDTAAGDNISTIQMLGSTFIRNLKVSLEGKEVFNSNNLHAYKTYFDTILNFNLEAKNTHLAAAGWYTDSADQNATNGGGFIARRNKFVGGARAQFVTKLDIDLFNQERYFINNTTIDIEIQPNSDTFMVLAPNLAAGDVSIRITSLRLRVAFPDVTDGLAVSLNEKLTLKPAVYPIRKSELKTVYLEAGRTEANVNIFNEVIPRRIIMGMVETTHYNGSYNHSPFNFQPFDLRHHHLEWNGIRTPSVQYEMNFNTGRYVVAYYEMMRNLGLAYTNSSNGITLESFGRYGNTIFVWNLTSTQQDDNCFELLKYGTTSYHATFDSALAQGVTLIFYAEMDSIIKIDYGRNVITDLTV